jgi:hypothetical protein
MDKRDTMISPPSLTNEENLTGSTVHIVTINNRKFVAGLFWQPLSNLRNFMAEARDIGKKRQWDIVAIRRSLRIQAGFVSKEAGALKGMYSLAAALAGQLGDTWLGAFALKEGQYAVVAVFDGSIVPGYDLIGSRDEALSALQSGYNLLKVLDKDNKIFRAESVYAPNEFDFSPYEHDIYALLNIKNLKKNYKLKPLTFGLTTKELIKVGLTLLAGSGMFWGYHEYQHYQQQVEREAQLKAEQIRRLQLERLDSHAKQAQLKTLLYPWSSIPLAVDFVAACSEAIHALPLSIAGWVFDIASCDHKGVSVSYARRVANTTVKQFSQHSKAYFSNEAIFTDQGNTALLENPLSLASGKNDALAPTTEILTEFVAYFQALDIPLKLEEKQLVSPEVPSLQGQVQQTPPPIPSWRQFAFEYQTELAPPSYFMGLPHQNGVRITNIKAQLNEEAALLNWTVSGEIYAKR